ncbi:MAG: hypothetical protein AAF127_00135 [Pseudomonadota bacterium]
MTFRLTAPLAITASLLSACSQEQNDGTPDETLGVERTSEDVARAAFTSSDSNQDEVIDAEEIEMMSSRMFASMDYDDSGWVTAEEFDQFDFGLVTSTKAEGKLAEYATAKRILFALQDLNSDGALGMDEHLRSLELGFARADRNENGAMEKDEYGRAFLPNIVMRAALDGAVP